MIRRTAIVASAIALLLLVPALLAQSMTEAAAVAAGGSIGAAAGKKVSEGIDSVFGKSGKLLGGAAKQGEKTDKKYKLFLPPTSGQAKPDPATAQAVEPPAATRVAPRPRADRTSPVEVSSLPQATPQKLPAYREPSVEEIRSVEQGAAREAVVEKLGRPSASVFIPEDGGREILSYRAHGDLIGSVRLTAGVVTNVRTTP